MAQNKDALSIQLDKKSVFENKHINNHTTNVMIPNNDEGASICGMKPLNLVVSGLIGSTFVSIIWSFYSVAIEIIPMQEGFNKCPYTIQYNWHPGNNTACKNFLETQGSYTVANSTFWSLMVVAGLTPWVVISIIAVITTHDRVNKKYKEYWWCLLGFLLFIYFAILLAASFSGIGIYLYGSPAFIGVPMTLIIPSHVGFMKTVNICKNVVCFINIPICICYFMISTSLIILTSYIVWIPSTFYDMHYKTKVLIGCAYYYAFLASLILTYEIDYIYKFDDYPEIEDYSINVVEDSTIKHIDASGNDIETCIEDTPYINNNNQVIIHNERPLILAHLLSGGTVLVTTSWLSITKSYANIIILVMIAILPMIATGIIKLQQPFNQYMISLRKN